MANLEREIRASSGPHPPAGIAARLVRMFGIDDADALARAAVSSPNFADQAREEWRAIAAEIERIKAVWEGLL